MHELAVATANHLACVPFAELSSHPSYVPSDDEPEDQFWVLNMGASFRYVVPNFDVLAVELWQMRVGGDSEGAGKVYDVFIRGNDVAIIARNNLLSSDESERLLEYRGMAKSSDMEIVISLVVVANLM